MIYAKPERAASPSIYNADAGQGRIADLGSSLTGQLL
jgi:hypothetical protein